MRQPTKEDLDLSWKKLSGKKIYFGHMSVGSNIIEGMRDLLPENSAATLNIVETREPSQFKAPLFAHSRIGKNDYPLSKLEDFDKLLAGLGKSVDIAFMKFCFVDVTERTDVQALFARYKDALASLQKKYPRTLFIHVTVPLTTVQGGPKAFIKKLINRPIDGYADNIKRNQYNDLIRKEYPAAKIYDLAAVESTLPDGTRSAFSHEGRTCYSLAREYAKDQGHLNTTGRMRAASNLLTMLANLAH